MRARVITVGVALCVACKGSEREVPKPPLAGVRVVDLIPVSLSGESWQDAEPFLALYASNPRLMAASAFTPNPGGSASATAPIFVSDDGGDSWTLRNTLPSQTMTADITHAVGGNPPVLYAGIMKVPDFPLNELKANDLSSPATMILQGFRADIDQPFVRTSAVGNADRVYIGAEPLQYHGRGREQVVRLELVEGEVGHLHDSGVQHGRVAPDGVGDIGRHRLAGEGVAERPGVASIVGDENGRGRAGGAAGIRREGGGRHETRVRGVQRQEWLGVLPAFPTQRDRDQVHNPYARQLGRWLWHFSL